MNIAIVNRQRVRKINLRLLKKITRALLAELELEESRNRHLPRRRAGNDPAQ